jgi:CheY-like chemotaxis protein
MLAEAITRCEDTKYPQSGLLGAQTSARLAGLVILLVEDNLVNQKVAAELLNAEGCELICCHDGEQALASLNTSVRLPDVILMDLQMPNLDGFATTKLIQSITRYTEIPVIAMTANASEEECQRCLAAGMVAHVGKPFNFEAMVTLLQGYRGRQTQSSGETSLAKGADLRRAGLTVVPAEISASLRQLAEAAGIDWDLTQQRLDGQLAFYLKMLPVFIRSLEQISRELGQSRPENITALLHLSHKLKGSAAQMGLQELAELAAQLEQQLKEQQALTEEELLGFSRFVQSSVDALLQFRAALPAEWVQH